MDYHHFHSYDNYENNLSHSNPPNPNYHAQAASTLRFYEKLTFALGIISILTCSIIYISFITGAMAILFAILSKGGHMIFSKKARFGMVFGIIGFILTISFYTIAFQIALEQYGSMEALLREACEMAGYDFETVKGVLELW